MTNRISAITVPKWGLTMEEGKVVTWLIDEGEIISVGDEVLELETSKIANVVEAQEAGTLRRIVASPEEELPVGALLGVMAASDIPDEEIDAFVTGFQENFVPEEASEDAGTGEPNYMDVGAFRIAWNVAGLAEGGALPVLFIHGFGGDSNSWLFNLGPLGTDRQVYTFDLPGHGKSSKTVGSGSIEDLATTVRGLMDALNIERAHLVGHSLGAAIAISIAQADEKRVASLTLIAPAGLGDTINEDFLAGFANAQSRREMKAVMGLLFADKSLVTRDLVDDTLKSTRIDGVREALQQIASENFAGGKPGQRFDDYLAQTALPCLLVVGDSDEIVSISDNLPAHIVAGTGHMPHMEAATEVNALITDHITRSGR